LLAVPSLRRYEALDQSLIGPSTPSLSHTFRSSLTSILVNSVPCFLLGSPAFIQKPHRPVPETPSSFPTTLHPIYISDGSHRHRRGGNRGGRNRVCARVPSCAHRAPVARWALLLLVPSTSQEGLVGYQRNGEDDNWQLLRPPRLHTLVRRTWGAGEDNL